MNIQSLTSLLKKVQISDKAESIPTFDQELSERAEIEYNKKELAEINRSKTVLLTQIESLKASGIKIYDNQTSAAATIVDNFADRHTIVQLIIGRCQSGKTSTMLSVVEQYISRYTIPATNLFIITGLSSIEWISQTKSRMPKALAERVYHRADLTKNFASAIKNLSNALVIIDETHIAKSDMQTLCNSFKKIGLLDLQYLLHKDIKILEFTATPNTLVFSLSQWGDYSKMVFAEPGKAYVGCGDLLAMGKIYQYKNLTGDKSVKAVVKTTATAKIPAKIPAKTTATAKTSKLEKQVIDNIQELKSVIDAFDDYRYHIIRTDVGKNQVKVISNFNQVFDKRYTLVCYDEKSNIDINDILTNEPTTHVIIFIKEMLRCAKTLSKKYLGVLYERYNKISNEDTIIQGLCGRLCGYDYNGTSVVFTDISSVESYEKRYADKFELSNGKKDNKYKKPTFNDPKVVKGLAAPQESKTESKKYCGEYKLFNTEDELMAYYKNAIKIEYTNSYASIKPKSPAADGIYYESVGGKKVALSIADAIQMGLAEINSGTIRKVCRYLVGYTADSVVQFILVYKL